MRTCVIFNPAARGEKAARFRDHLGELSGQCTLKPTYAAGSGRTLAAEAAREGFEVIVAAGGDGTVNEVVNGIGDVAEAFASVRFGVLPLGTVNVFARELNLPLDFAGAWQIIQNGRETRMDLPLAEFPVNGQPTRRYFAQMAGAGLDARAIALVDWELKKKIGPLAYVVAGARAMMEPKPVLVAAGQNDGAAGQLVLIGNGRFYGGRFVFFPKADKRDGLLDVTVFPKVNWFNVLRAGFGLLSNDICGTTGAIMFQTPNLTLTCPQPRVFELDGENVGDLPAKFSVLPQRLRLVVP